jgi:addiction module RelE/StbE family toxin
MILITYHRNFLKSAQLLSAKLQKKLAKLIELCAGNPFHPLLHTTRLTGDLAGFLSFRITRDWRVIFQFVDPDTIQLLRVKHRKDAYR